MLRTLYGLILCIGTGASFMFVLPLVAVVTAGQVQQNLGLVLWCIAASLVGISFLNASIFFMRLKRASPGRYLNATSGMGFLDYVGHSGRKLLSTLHAQIALIAADQGPALPVGIRVHARISRYVNLIAFWYAIAGVIFIEGIIVLAFLFD
ncbi:MAG TPA: hypothetical protein VMC81_04830 [Rhodocyclaceae bacterium]|nr:hypothetical protein [Rhodocyclaceae bacterium]